MLRNGDWNYAAFSPDMKLRAGVNQAECLACHKPLDKASFLFSLEPLCEGREGALKPPRADRGGAQRMSRPGVAPRHSVYCIGIGSPLTAS
jgi:hypothetical protein